MRGADPSPPDAAVNAAARAGDVEKVIALVDAGAAIGAWTTSCAAASGSLALLRELAAPSERSGHLNKHGERVADHSKVPDTY